MRRRLQREKERLIRVLDGGGREVGMGYKRNGRKRMQERGGNEGMAEGREGEKRYRMEERGNEREVGGEMEGKKEQKEEKKLDYKKREAGEEEEARGE